ncbi:unnamed protein product [Arabidopsis thaliana]|uniref:At2g14460 n=2 Tax=Arabidopsis thaliana TaxID=3702 RepID=Q9ZQQ9_ARATH|nr:uncharacterized protein AT2G14460 [Arabidopsis thaliana]AAD15469.1 unknown protein [Arabidopsis thaliana]AAQ89645.1 At2g14460 [Arabidopsis thaliana]AEC06305.1 hypothetical protein AT2G14460 [Arabidopsis thaliana]VYS52370.1 unnamed protein product [Arabidopsis thaliana]BAD94471.1 hypothetical protein [Arabidopsis thaliana]|eukprot:NP_179053.1 hypothetical protein AT2G14460 [Arabidopsis thaliana]
MNSTANDDERMNRIIRDGRRRYVTWSRSRNPSAAHIFWSKP